MTWITPECVGKQPCFHTEHSKWVEWSNNRDRIRQMYSFTIRPNVQDNFYDYVVSCTATPNAPPHTYGCGEVFGLAEVTVAASLAMNNAIRNHKE